MSEHPYPFRVRRYQGRTVHAARYVLRGSRRATACGHLLLEGPQTLELTPTAAIDCAACKREVRREVYR